MKFSKYKITFFQISSQNIFHKNHSENAVNNAVKPKNMWQLMDKTF